MMNSTGHYESRPWVSSLNPLASASIDVYIPNLTSDTYRVNNRDALAELESGLAALSRSGDSPSVAPILTRSEGIASSRIEGLVMSTRRVYEAKLRERDVDDHVARQIVANMDVMSEVTSMTEPLSHHQIHRWHRSIMQADPLTPRTAGEYRTQQNWIGTRADTPVGAVYIPPPPDLVPDLMEDLVRFANERTLSPVVQAAVVHAQFETIHPYGDGNGRIGRALIYWILSNRGAITDFAPPISPMIVEAAGTYVQGLTDYRRDNPSAWIDTFVDLLNGAVGYTQVLGTAVRDLQVLWKERVRDIRAGSVDHRIIEHLTTVPIVDAAGIAQDFDVTTQAAGAALRRLEDRGILVNRSLRRGRRGRPAKVFEATELFDLLDERPQSLAARGQSETDD